MESSDGQQWQCMRGGLTEQQLVAAYHSKKSHNIERMKNIAQTSYVTSFFINFNQQTVHNNVRTAWSYWFSKAPKTLKKTEHIASLNDIAGVTSNGFMCQF